MLRELEERGYALIEGALRAEEVERLTAAVDRVHAEHGEGPLHRLGFVGLDPSFLELVDHPATLPLVCGLLGWNIYVYHSHLDVHPPLCEQPGWRWHQDGGRQSVELEAPRPRLSVKVAYYLTDATEPERGPTWVVPGSHVREQRLRPEDGFPEGAVPLLAPAGSAVLLDRRLWHARGVNSSSVTRKALFYAYTYRWVRPRDDLGLDGRLDVAALDPVRRQLLGAGTGLLGYWEPRPEEVPLRGVARPLRPVAV